MNAAPHESRIQASPMQFPLAMREGSVLFASGCIRATAIDPSKRWICYSARSSRHCSSFSATRCPLVTRCKEGVQKWKTEHGFVEGKNGFNCVSCGTCPWKSRVCHSPKTRTPPKWEFKGENPRGEFSERHRARILSDADRQRMHRQQYKGRDEHAADSGSNSGLQSRIDTVVAAAGRLDPRCIGFRGHSI